MEANRESGYPFVPPFSRYSSSLECSHVGIRRGLEEGAAVSRRSGSAVPLPWLLCSFQPPPQKRQLIIREGRDVSK